MSDSGRQELNECAFIGYAMNNIASMFYNRNAKVIIE